MVESFNIYTQMNIASTAENHRGRSGTMAPQQKPKQDGGRRRLIFFPLPFQGHINPMLQLANILHTRGFEITIIHTQYNSPNHSNYPHFTFKPLHSCDSSKFTDLATILSTGDFSFYFETLNRVCADSARECLAELLADDRSNISCLISDALMYGMQPVADELKLPRIVLRTSSSSCLMIYAGFIPFHIRRGSYDVWKQDIQVDEPIPEFPIFKVKDIRKITEKPEGMWSLVAKMYEATKESSGLIWNTFKELEEDSLEAICKEFPIPNFAIGPFHKYFPASSSSLLEQDQSCISWLDLQAPSSVIYVSFGSAAQIDDSEFQEIAMALANSRSPFLWVVRPGSVLGSEWLGSLPEGFLKDVGDRGLIVKWAPQQQVLAHSSTGCFWTHCGWNSTLESICEGVPMICSPGSVDQPINARYINDVWRIGALIENGFQRDEIGRAIERVMVDEEGEEMRKRINILKEKANICLEKGGSSYLSLESLADYILSL